LAGRFWQLRGSEAGSEIGDWCNTSTYQHLNAFTTDLELTRRFCAGCWQGQLAFGVRHAEVDLDTCLRAEQYFEAVDPDDDSAISGLANAISQFHGTGLTFGLWTKRPISSRVYLFGGLRGSVLWGEAANGGAATAAYANSDGFEHDAYVDVCVRDETMFIGEVQVGLQYECPLRCLPANAFFRVAFEYQNWSVSSPSNQVVAYREELNAIGVESIVTSSDVDMQLVGFNLGAGITW
jgi:hypothetical protein